MGGEGAEAQDEVGVTADGAAVNEVVSGVVDVVVVIPPPAAHIECKGE